MSLPFTKPDIRERLFGGEGSVKVESLRGALAAPFTAALNCELSAGGSVGKHVQATDDEIVIALEGEAVLYVDGAARPAMPGVVVGLRLGATLEIVNASVENPFRYLIVKVRAGS